MKKFNLKKMVAYVLVAMLTLGVFSVSASAADKTDYENAVAVAQEAGIRMDAATRAELEAIVREAAESLDIVEEGVESEKSTFVSFAEHPVKIVKYDGEGHGLKGVAVKTIALTKVADTENLYVGMTEDGTIYRSFAKPVEPGFYYAVCMYAGDADNYPSVGYGIVVILPACEEEEPTEAPAETPTEAPATDAPAEEPTEAPATDAPVEEPTEAPATEAPVEEITDAPKTGDESQVMLYAALTVAALGGMAAILFKKRNA